MDSKTLIVPTSLADITLKQYKQFMSLPEHLNEEDRVYEMIHIFTGLSRGLIRKMTMKSRSRVVLLLQKCINTREEELVMTTTLNGVKLGFVPNLDKMSFGEFVDLDSTKYEYQNYEALMKVLYRPIVKERNDRYEIMDYKHSLEQELDYNEMTMDCVLGALLFFCGLGNDLLKHMMKSLREEKGMTTAQEQTLRQNGVGTAVLLASLNMTLEALIALRESHFISV